MRKALITALIALCAAAAHAQTYDQRAAAERGAAALQAYDDMKMQQARDAQHSAQAQRDREQLAERERPIPWGGLAGLAAFVVVFYAVKLTKKSPKKGK